MGLFEKIFGKDKRPNNARVESFRMLNGYTPVFTSWNGRLYESELVRAAIDARARHISKMDIKFIGTAKPSMKAKLEQAPNDWQTWSQFFYRLSTILDVTNTALIVPVFDRFGDTTGIYPVLPEKAEMVQYAGQPWVRFRFANGTTASLEYDKIGIMTKYQYKNDIFGESNRALDPTMKLLHIQNQGIEEGVKSAASYRFMATMSNFTNEEDLALERGRFTRENLEAGGGLLLFPNTYKDIKQIDSKPFVVDAEQMKLIQTNVYNYFGVNEEVLQNKAYGDRWAAFYEGAIEPFAVQFSEVATGMLYTEREKSLGAKIMATSDKLQYMSNADKLAVSAQMADRGLMTRNEIRAIWNMPPLPAEIGDTLPIRGEYYNVGEKTTGDSNEQTD